MENKTTFKELNLSNAFLFAVTLADKAICKLLLETTLGKKLPDLKLAHPEHTILISSDFRSARFDVYASDVEGASYDLEMQTTNNKDLGLRSRFYQGQIDIQSMKPGDKYKELQPSYIIFICTFDPFEQGLYKYTIKNTCSETGELIDDGITRIFLNTKGHKGDVSTQLKDLLEYIQKSTDEVVENTDEESPVRVLHKRVTEVKHSAEMEAYFMTGQDLIDEARDIGEKRGGIGIINAMRTLNATQEQIVAQLISQMGLSEAEALKLLEEK